MIEIKNTKKSERKNDIMEAIKSEIAKAQRANRMAIMKLKKHLKGPTVPSSS